MNQTFKSVASGVVAVAVSYDTYGKQTGSHTFEAGCHRMPVPPSGYLRIFRQ